jgi:hypothetical protein
LRFFQGKSIAHHLIGAQLIDGSVKHDQHKPKGKTAQEKPKMPFTKDCHVKKRV